MFTLKDITEKFKEYNAKYFNNELPKIELKAPNRKTSRRYGTFRYSYGVLSGIKCSILIYQLTSRKGDDGWENTLLHEMIHYHLFQKYVRNAIENYASSRTYASARAVKNASRLSGHTPEFKMLLKKYWAMETSGESKVVPAPVAPRYIAPVAVAPVQTATRYKVISNGKVGTFLKETIIYGKRHMVLTGIEGCLFPFTVPVDGVEAVAA